MHKIFTTFQRVTLFFLLCHPWNCAQGGPDSVVFTGPIEISGSVCTPYTAILLKNGFTTPATNSVTFPLQGSGKFYSDNSCSYGITSRTFSIGQSSKPVHFKNTNNNEIGNLAIGDTTGESALGGSGLAVKVGNPPLASIQAMATSGLRALYTAETAFYAEYATYNTFLSPMGFDLSVALLARKYYRFGFSKAATLDPRVLAALTTANEGPISTSSWPFNFVALRFPFLDLGYICSRSSANFPIDVTSRCPNGVCTATATTFTAIAFGNIDGDATLDIWTIDQNRNLVHVVDDATQ